MRGNKSLAPPALTAPGGREIKPQEISPTQQTRSVKGRKVTHKKTYSAIVPAGWGRRQAKNPVESAYASPARLYLTFTSVTDKRAMSL